MDLVAWFMANPVALGAAIGASGSIAAQLLAAAINGYVASRKNRQEKEDRALDRAADERARFDAARREAFVEILRVAAAVALSLTEKPDGKELYRLDGELEKLAQRIEVVGLLAPAAYGSCAEVHRFLAVTREDIASGKEIGSPEGWWREFRIERIEPMRVAMRQVLDPTGQIALTLQATRRKSWRRSRNG